MYSDSIESNFQILANKIIRAKNAKKKHLINKSDI